MRRLRRNLMMKKQKGSLIKMKVVTSHAKVVMMKMKTMRIMNLRRLVVLVMIGWYLWS